MGKQYRHIAKELVKFATNNSGTISISLSITCVCMYTYVCITLGRASITTTTTVTFAFKSPVGSTPGFKTITTKAAQKQTQVIFIR